jgi:hypothetical protein
MHVRLFDRKIPDTFPSFSFSFLKGWLAGRLADWSLIEKSPAEFPPSQFARA